MTSALDLTGADIIARIPRASALLARARESNLSLDGVWLVGGAVRDAILDRDTSGPDIDIAVEGAGVDFAHLLASATGGEVASHASAFGTAKVVVPIEGFGAIEVDVASCRTETYAAPGALPTVSLGASITEDLHRRDFSANAIAVSLDASHPIVDTQGGREDIDARILRVLHDGSFLDDPTRVFRAARYAGRLGFRVDEHTRALAKEAVVGGGLGTVSADRVCTELRLVLREPAWNALTLLSSWGVIERLDPRLEAAFRPPLLLRSLDEACGTDPDRNRRAWPLRLAALARPLGPDASGWMGWLGFPSDVVEPVTDHLRVLDPVLARPDELRAMRNSDLYIEFGEIADDTMALVALAIADNDPPLLQRLVDFATVADQARLTVRGHDVIAAGVPAGPLVGRILGDLFLRTLDGELHGEADERRALSEIVAAAQQLVDDHDDDHAEEEGPA